MVHKLYIFAWTLMGLEKYISLKDVHVRARIYLYCLTKDDTHVGVSC